MNPEANFLSIGKNFQVTFGLDSLNGRAKAELLRALLEEAGLTGLILDQGEEFSHKFDMGFDRLRIGKKQVVDPKRIASDILALKCSVVRVAVIDMSSGKPMVKDLLRAAPDYLVTTDGKPRAALLQIVRGAERVEVARVE